MLQIQDPFFRISGFELLMMVILQVIRAQSNPRLGDTFSFATGSKTFLTIEMKMENS